MIRLFFIKLIKLLMMTTPFLSMILMLCALWGVVGKTTYADLNGLPAQKHLAMPEAKNYLVNETKKSELCPTVPEILDKTVDKDDSGLTDKKFPNQKIDWEHTV